MSDSRKADHTFEGLADCPYSGACHYILADGRPCWLTKSEHEAHPEPEPAPCAEDPDESVARMLAEPEPAPESEEPPQDPPEDWTRPEPPEPPCDSVRPEAITAQLEPKVTIAGEPSPSLRKLAEEWIAIFDKHHTEWLRSVYGRGMPTDSERAAHDAERVALATRLLESVVAAAKRGEFGE